MNTLHEHHVDPVSTGHGHRRRDIPAMVELTAEGGSSRPSALCWSIVAMLLPICPKTTTPVTEHSYILRFADEQSSRPQAASGLMFSADGRILAAIDWNRFVAWDTQTGKALHVAKPELSHQLFQLGDDVVVLERVQLKRQGPWASCNLRHAATGAVVPCTPYSSLIANGMAASFPGCETVSFLPSLDLAACIVNRANSAPASPVVIDGNQGPPRSAFLGEIQIFTLSTGKPLRTLPAPTETGAIRVSALGLDSRQAQARALVLSPDGKRIAALAPSGTITIWNCLDGKVVVSLAGECLDPFRAEARLLPDGELFLSPARRALIWAADSSALITISPGEAPHGVRRLVQWDLASASSRSIEWVGTKAERTGEDPAAAGGSRPPQASKGVPDATCISVFPDLKHALIVQALVVRGNTRTGGLELVDLAAGKPLGLIRVAEADSIRAIAYSPDASRVALATGSGSIVLLPTSTIETFAREHRSLVDVKSTISADAETGK